MERLKHAIQAKDWQVVNVYLTNYFQRVYGTQVVIKHLAGYVFTLYNMAGIPIGYVSYMKKWGEKENERKDA